MSAEGWLAVALILAPVALLGVVLILRGYHLHVKVWKGDLKEPGRRDDTR